MRLPRLLTAAFIVALCATTAGAFRIDVHEELTRSALEEVLSIWKPPQSVRDVVGTVSFTRKAAAEVVGGNLSKDTCRPGETDGSSCTVLGSRTIAALLNTTVNRTWAEVLSLMYDGSRPPGQFPEEHFDRELINEGNALLVAHREEIRAALKKKDFVGARKMLGGALHAIQDFYAHSNWVELNKTDLLSGLFLLENRLGEGSVGASDFRGSPRLAGKNEYVCLDGSVLMSELNLEQTSRLLEVLNTIPKEEAAIIQKTLDDFPLTTEYFGYPEDGTEIREFMKCRHGLAYAPKIQLVAPAGTINTPIGQFAVPGIDKDVPGSRYHDVAKHLAKLHSVRFILHFLNDAELQKEPAVFMGLMGYPMISSVTPVSVRVGDGPFYVHVEGGGFDAGGVKAKPAVFWNGKALESAPLNEQGTRLDARVESADAGAPGTVKVTVQQQEVDEDGDLTGKTLTSNAVSVRIDGPEPDCPGAIRPHRHDPRYMDVNANRWNDTGLVVIKGQPLNIEVLQGAAIWRTAGLLSFNSGEASPLGDPSATPGSVLLWVDPPIPINRAPIGALIAMVVPPDLLDAEAKPTVALTEKPEGVTFFPVMAGGRNTPPAPSDGRLYLGINDGAFFNNAGCFQARVVK